MVDQTEFSAALLDANIPTPTGLLDPEGRPAGKRFDVYRNNVVVSLIDAMEQAFPAIQSLVGPEFFRAMAGVFVRAHPPKTPMLMFYGEAFPEFLRQFEHVAHLPYLADVAQLELARRKSYHAADHKPIAHDALSKIAPEELGAVRFEFAASMDVFEFKYPALSIRKKALENPQQDVPARGETVLLARLDFEIIEHLISDAEALFVHQLRGAASLDDALEQTTKFVPDFDLARILGLLLSTAVITKLY